jgi:hypothetical protein
MIQQYQKRFGANQLGQNHQTPEEIAKIICHTSHIPSEFPKFVPQICFF